MTELNTLRSQLIGIDHSINILEKEKEKINKKILKLTTCDKELYQSKYNLNYKKFSKGIPQSKKPSKVLPQIGNNLDIEQIGRLGEESYFQYLKDILDLDFCEVEWINEKEETGKSFDFLVKIGRATFYVDVKTTRGRQNAKMYLSRPELNFAKKRKPNYFVARLSYWDDLKRFKANNFNVKMLCLDEAIKLTKSK